MKDKSSPIKSKLLTDRLCVTESLYTSYPVHQSKEEYTYTDAARARIETAFIFQDLIRRSQ
jgi:hypothetical protein